MGDARLSGKKYTKGKKRQMTTPWKIAVHAKLQQNQDTNQTPGNVRELEDALGLKAGTLGHVLKYEGFTKKKPEQTSSVHVDEICRVLKIQPPNPIEDEATPLVEVSEPDNRAALEFVIQLAREIRSAPEPLRGNIERLISKFIAESNLG